MIMYWIKVIIFFGILLLSATNIIQAYQCTANGICNARVIAYYSSVTSCDSCATYASSNSECTYFTYNPNAYECYLYADCPEINQNGCSTCMTSSI